MTRWAFRSATELARSLRDREVGAEELLDYFLGRVERLNPKINAVVARDEARARERARRADAAVAAGEVLGPLHGVPITVKESFDVAGLPSTHGIPEMRGNVAERDALAVQRLEAAGAIVFGKTNVPLRLADFQSYNEIYGTTENPYLAGRVPGGSSGGSAAALAAGLTGLELGSDIGGSIRNPAHFCGVFGHKPTWDLLPPRGHAAPGVLSSTDIAVIGPLARSAEDLELALQVLAGPDEISARAVRYELPVSGKPIASWRVAVWPDDAAAPVGAESRARIEAVAQLFADAGATVDHAARPAIDPALSQATYDSLLQPAMSGRLPDERFAELLARADALEAGDDSARARTLRNQVLRHRDWLQAHEARTHLRWAWHEFFQQWDVLLTPMMATPAFPHDHRPFGERTIDVDGAPRPYFEQIFWAGLTGVAFLPSTVVPTGPGAEGLPLGVQIAGPEWGDRITIEAARFLEQSGLRFVPPAGFEDE
ncbi:MAG: amidase [Acidobacteria bacterium]|nr:MAG: amidase [Acidobacteriota bacterium]